MIKVAICDNENIIVAQIENILLSICRLHSIELEIDVFYSGETLEKNILKGLRYDLLYLDILLKGEDGITAAKNIRKIDKNVLVIYVSDYYYYFIELFRLDVFDFILKPIDSEKLAISFLDAYERICSKKVYYHFQYKNADYKVLLSEIIYFESKGRQIQIHLLDKNIEVFNAKLNQVEAQLEHGKIPFLRIHQSYLVNYHLIRVRSKTRVVMITGQELPISEDRQKSIGIIYNKLLGSEN